MAHEDDGNRRLRADARANREQLLCAARDVFGEQGLDASIAEVARRADVGIGTLYRHFPDRDALVTAVFDEKMDAYSAAIEDAHADPDPWRGFCTYVERVCAMQAGDRGFMNVLTSTFPSSHRFEARRRSTHARLVELIGRAQEAGRLRPDFVAEDVALLLMANAGVVAATAHTIPDAWRRTVSYLLQAFDARNTDPLPPAPTPARMVRAMARTRRGTRSR